MILSACGNKKTSEPTDNTSSPTVGNDGNTPSSPHQETITDDDGNTPNDIFKGISIKTNTAEHKKYEGALPSSFTLVNSGTLPPIDNRNGINCQAAEAITYMQFTNAVARYLKNKNPNSTWDPSTSESYRFSPISTFYGTGAAASYDTLRDNGAFTKDVFDFDKSVSGLYRLKNNGKYVAKSIAWPLTAELAMKGIEYRLVKYEAINTSNTQKTVRDTGYYDVEKSGVNITNSDNGKALLEKIKDAIATGNVVVAQGYSDRWVTEKLAANSGTLGKRNDTVITYSTDSNTTLYQIAIVGYDDDLEITTCGVTLKGAFLLANCEGTSWGTDGYAWLMYDALNTNSEFEDFAVPEGTKRSWAVDYFYFTYWDVDITENVPEMYAELELDISNRNTFKVELSRTDGLARTNLIYPALPYHASSTGAPKYDLAQGYFNPAGIENGEAVNGVYLLNFERLLTSIPENSTYEDFLWGIKITSTDEKYPVIVKRITIKNAAGTVLRELDLDEGQTIANDKYTYLFDFGKDKIGNYLSGSYKFQNVATGNYIIKDTSMTFKTGTAASDALDFVISYDSKTGMSKIYRNDESYAMDFLTAMNTGTVLQFNAKNDSDPLAQKWTVSYNDDGTVSFYTTSEKGTNYAIGELNGKICLVKATELSDNIKWNLTRNIRSGTDADLPVKLVKSTNGMTFSGTTPKKVSSIDIKVKKLDGTEVLSTNVTVTSRAFSTELALKDADTYVIYIYNPENEGALFSCCYMVTIE